MSAVTTEAGAAEQLHEAVYAAMKTLPGVVQTIRDVRAASATLPNEIIATMRWSISAIIALEAAADAMDAAHKAARAALAASMADTGASNISTKHHTAGLRAVPPKVIVTGPVPDEFMTTPEPRPDLAKIKTALKERPANWATLSAPSETLVITSRRAS